MTLSARLWADNSDLAAEALAHPFVCRLSDGSLAREIFASYVAQDAFFLESFARAYALALARSSDTPTLLALADLLAGVREELGLHASYAARWGIDMAGVEPASATWPTPSSCSRPPLRPGWARCSRPWLRACGSTHGLVSVVT